MSILIKGMAMPSNCWDCRVETLTGQCPCNIGIAEASDYRDRRHEDCPISEVTTPHGRLIDADALMSTIKEHDYLLYDRLTDTTKPGMFTFGIEYAVCTAPTIIEAEE